MKCKICFVLIAGLAVPTNALSDDTRIRAGHSTTIVGIRNGPEPLMPANVAGIGLPHPQPRLAGFSPLVAITTSDKKRPPVDDSPWEHTVENSFAGNMINLFPEAPYIIGYLDSGAVVDLTSDFYGFVLGLTGEYLTDNTIPIGGVGGTVDAFITQPVGYFAAGFSAINNNGVLDFGALKGHSNVSIVVGPDLDCGNGEELTAIVGTPMMSFFNSVIRVDSPKRVLYDDRYFLSPDVQILNQSSTLPEYSHLVALQLGGLSPVLTASFFPDFEFLETPLVPTMLSLTPISFPTGALYFTNMLLRQGPASPENLGTTALMMVDTGAQASIISPGVAASLNLPLEPDFTVDVCGVGGLAEDIPGYYVDFVQINALGGALRYSRAPFIVLDLQSPSGGPMDGILGMNFFWNRNIVFEPSLVGTPFLHVSDPVPFAAPDFDLDLHVDVPDASIQNRCSTGPGAGLVTPECAHTDIDGDGDVDLADFAVLQACFLGSELPADTACGH